MGIKPRTALGIVALLALANAPATSVSQMTGTMPRMVASGITAFVPVQPAEAAGRPAARPPRGSLQEVSRTEEGPGLERSDIVNARIPRQSGDLACLAEAVYFEARGTGVDGESAVAHVIVNRAKADSFPNSICGVVHDGCQFSYRCDGRSDALAEPSARAHAYKVAQAVLEGAPDITRGALYFHSAKASSGMKRHRKVGVIGGNVFYR